MRRPAIADRFVLIHVKIWAHALNRINANVNMVILETFVKSVSEKSNEVENFMPPPRLFIDSLPENILSGPNVCERIEMREEMERIVEQELVEVTIKEWCWPKIRCSYSKMEEQPVEKTRKAFKPHNVKYCCSGYAQNYRRNRCLPIEIEDDQQQVMQ